MTGSRKSKNRGNSQMYFSNQEKKQAGYGSLASRLGKDSQIKFGMCALSLQAVEDPVAT